MYIWSLFISTTKTEGKVSSTTCQYILSWHFSCDYCC